MVKLGIIFKFASRALIPVHDIGYFLSFFPEKNDGRSNWSQEKGNKKNFYPAFSLSYLAKCGKNKSTQNV